MILAFLDFCFVGSVGMGQQRPMVRLHTAWRQRVFYSHASWFVHGPLEFLAEGWNWNWMNCAKWCKKEVRRELWIKLYLAAVSCHFIYSTAIFAMFIHLFLDIIYVIRCYTKYKYGSMWHRCHTYVPGSVQPIWTVAFPLNTWAGQNWYCFSTLQQHIIEI